MASLWKINIKNGFSLDDFGVNLRLLKPGLLDNGYVELLITSEHTVSRDNLPPIHKDPFDHLLVVQAMVEGITLLTSDTWVARYAGSIILV